VVVVWYGAARLPQEQNGIVVPPDVTSDADLDPNAVLHEYYRTTNATYTDYVDIIISEAMRLAASVDVHTALRITISVAVSKYIDTNVVYLGKPRALVSKLPGSFALASVSLLAFSSVELSDKERERESERETERRWRAGIQDSSFRRTSRRRAFPPASCR
jgi:hypothetical protein